MKNKDNSVIQSNNSLLVSLGQSVRFLVHEIKNPLTAISFQCQMLRENLEEMASEVSPGGKCEGNAFLEENNGIVDIIENQVSRISSLCNNVNSFFVDPIGRDDKIELNSFIKLVVTPFKDKIKIICKEEPSFVLFDGEKLRSVLENLIKNAIESQNIYNERIKNSDDMPECSACFDSQKNTCSVSVAERCSEKNGVKPNSAKSCGRCLKMEGVDNCVEVTIKENDNSFYVIEIKDRGVGIEKDFEKKVFEPFFTTKASGSGIGLYLASFFVESRGGLLNLSSREGGGAVCTVSLPKFKESE